MFEKITVQADASSRLCASYFPTTKADDIRITFPKNSKTRARKVVSRSRARKTGKLPSWKMERMIQWESDNERIVFRILDGDATVIAFFEQPFTVHYVDDGVIRIHYPDVLVEFADGVEVWEIKDSRSSGCPELARRTQLLKALFAQLEICYRVVFVDKKFEEGIEAYSLSVLRLGRFPITQVERERARRFFTRQKVLSWRRIQAGILGKRGANIVARLLLEGELTSSNRSQALSPTTTINSSPETRHLVAAWRS